MPSIEQAYDDLLVPRIFAPWAEILLDLADVTTSLRVLDVATGSGPVARCAAQRIGLSGHVTATDISASMLDVARAKPPVEGDAAITYIQSSAAPLRVPSASFDLVTCQQSLQFFPDRLAALREMKRALRPGGQVAIAVWTAITDNEWFTAIQKALLATLDHDGFGLNQSKTMNVIDSNSLERDAGGKPVPTFPHPALGVEAAKVIEAPFRWPDASELRSTIEAAGFRDVRLTRIDGALIFEEGIEQAIAALDAMPIAPILAMLPDSSRDAFHDRLRLEAQPLLNGTALIGKMASNIAIGMK